MQRESITVGGRTRTFRHVAPSRLDPAAPLLLALHGTSQQGATMRRFSGRTLDALAERIGADLVYLDGTHRAWNDARRIRTSRAQKEGVDDVGAPTDAGQDSRILPIASCSAGVTHSLYVAFTAT